MPWEEITLPDATLTFRASGNLLWNSALQLTMGDPTWVDVMWDAAERWLGIRAVNSPTGFPVHPDPENSLYKIDSAAALNAAGISVEEAITGAPDSWYQRNKDEGDWFGYNPVYYIALPE